jgi:uncharacterized membrane protein YczE
MSTTGGLAPWDVLHQGLAVRTGLSIGLVVNLVAAAVLVLWPLRLRPGAARRLMTGLVRRGHSIHVVPRVVEERGKR